MGFGRSFSSTIGDLQLQKALALTDLYLENLSKTTDPDIFMVLCYNAEDSLSQVKKAAKHNGDKAMHERIAANYIYFGDMLDANGHRREAQTFYDKSVKWGGRVHQPGQPTIPTRPVGSVSSASSAPPSAPPSTTSTKTAKKPPPQPSPQNVRKQDIAIVARNIFPTNIRPPTLDFKPPEPDSRLNDTPQLACCLGLLQSTIEPDEVLDQKARTWLEATKDEPDEKERLSTLATDVIRAFKRDEFKNAKSVTEIVHLAPVLEGEDFRYLLKEFYMAIEQSGLLEVNQLEGLARLVQGGGFIDSDDLVKVLDLLNTLLQGTHEQSSNHRYKLTMALSHVLDAMADAKVEGLARKTLHEPLKGYLDEMRKGKDPYLVYQAAYAYQALLLVPDDETPWQAAMRRTGKVIKGVAGLVSAVKGLDLNKFFEGIVEIQQGAMDALEIAKAIKDTYNEAMDLAESGKDFIDCMKEGLSFSRPRAWYSALRGADTLIRDGLLADFRKLVCEVPCRRDPAFLWGVCERLGEIAANNVWEPEIRKSAILFLGEIYRDDAAWGRQPNLKQWILNILMQLSSLPGSEMQFAETQLQELQTNGDAAKQALYLECREKGHGSQPLSIVLPAMGTPSLLDRAQEKTDVEGSLRQLRRQRLKERGNAVYIQPQAKASLQARDESRFPLMEKVDEFLKGDQKVFLLLGDSGAGKSTFNRELEYHLWQDYKKGKTIPLFITLPALDKPEHDMIAKQLRKAEFTEPQIRELKFHRKFTLICDGYDESKQIHNLYMSNRLNQPGEWKAVMIISCRSEYVGVDYRDRFQPVDRNHRSEQSLFQEAVMTPFGMEQVHDYIKQYVDVYHPLWEADQYENALSLIPSLKELVKNPFLMSLSLDVLPRIVDPGQDLSTTHITRMALYDQFIEHWLERGKKRLGEKNLSPQARSAFESLIDDGFTRNGIDYLKKLSAAIYKQQGGQPIVSYSRYKDENSWKAPFFSREEETHLLREACPLIRNGNQHRFIHRSLLEYTVALAIFDPEDWKDFMVPAASVAQNTQPTTSTGGNDPTKETSVPETQEPDSTSPLYWRSFVDEPAVLQFLEERVRQEPLFEKQLFDYIEHSRKDKKWSKASANAITILIRAGHQFNGADLRGIRIPRADLSYGMFEEAQFEGADLSYVDLRGTWLRKANLGFCSMIGVQFGELPYLNLGNKVWVSVYSPDGTTMAIGLNNGKIIMYSTSNWEPLWTSQEHSKEVVSIAYSPAGDQIASGGSDITIRVWNVQTGDRISALSGHGNTVAKVVYSPEGNQLASGSYDKTVKLWDVKTGECSHTWTDHTDLIEGVVYSPKRKQIASNSRDGTVRLWDTESKKCLHILSGHSGSVESVSYSPEGDQLASGSKDSTVRLWDVATGNCLYVLNHGGEVYSIAFSPKGDQFASGGFDGPLGSVRLWDVERGAALRTLRGHTKCISKVVYSPHGNLIASASLDKTTRVWDLETGACRQTLSGHSGDVTGATFSPKGDQVASYSEDGTVRLYEVGVKETETSQYLSSGHVGRVTKVEYSPKGKHIATCGKDMTVRFWDFKTGICRQILRGHKGEVTSMAYSPEGDQIASGSTDKTVRLWIVDRGTCIHTLTGHEGAINHVTYLTGGDLLASSSRDKTIRLWDTRSGECRYTLTGHTIDIHRLQYLPNRNQVVSASIDSTIRIWDAEKGVCKHVLSCPEGVMGISYSPQGDRIASANGLTVRVWDVESGACLHALSGHKKGVFSIKYSPGGQHIASGDMGGTVIVWNVATKASLWTLTGHTGSIFKLEYSTQGHVLVSASTDKSVRVWNMATGTGLFAIQNYPEEIRDIDWIEVAGTSYLVTALEDGMVETSRLKPDMTSNSLCWRTAMAELDMFDTSIESIQGLDVLYEKLFIQRGARGDPLYKSREEVNKALAMGVVLAKLGTPVTLSHVQPPPPPILPAAAAKVLAGVSVVAPPPVPARVPMETPPPPPARVPAGTIAGVPLVPARLPTESPVLPPTVPARLPAESPILPPTVPARVLAESPVLPPGKAPAESPVLPPAVSAKALAESPILLPARVSAESPILPPKVPASVLAESPILPPTVPARVPAESPILLPATLPAKVLAESPVLPPTVPAKVLAESPILPPARAPAESPVLPPARAPAESPVLPPARVLAESPVLPPAVPARLPAESPILPPARAPAESPVLPPARLPAESPILPPTVPTKVLAESPILPPKVSVSVSTGMPAGLPTVPSRIPADLLAGVAVTPSALLAPRKFSAGVPVGVPAKMPAMNVSAPATPMVQRAEQLKQRAEQSNDPLLQEIVAAIIKDIHGR